MVAVRAGVDAIGLVFYKPSPRFVDIELAASIAEAVPPFVTVTGLFVDHCENSIHEVLRKVRIDLMQFHGEETLGQCETFNRPYIKALRIKKGKAIEPEFENFPTAAGFLLDTYRPGVPGGTGEAFDWSHFPKRLDKPLILAGGLNPDNIENAISVTRPFAVDVSGGVESQKGVKSPELINRFICGVKRADNEG